MQVNTLPSCSKSGNFAKANLELEIEGSYRKMIPFFNFTAMYLLKCIVASQASATAG